MNNLIQKVKKFFSPSSTKVKSFRPIYLGKSEQEQQIITNIHDHTEQKLKEGRESIDDLSAYLTYEHGCIQAAMAAMSSINESTDNLWLPYSNQKDKTQKEVDELHQYDEHQSLVEPKNRKAINSKEIRKRKAIQLVSSMEQLATLKKFRSSLDKGLKEMSEKLPFGIDHRKGYASNRIWIFIGLTIASLCEFSVIFNSLKILRAPLELEAVSALGLSLGVFTLSKGIVYLASNANYLFWRILEQDTQTDSEIVEIKMGLYDIATVWLFLFGMGFTAILGQLRISYLIETGVEVSFFTRILLWSIGPFMFVVTIVLSMMLFNPAGKRQEYYTKVLKQFNRVEKKILRIQKQLAKSRTKFLAELTSVEHTYQDQYKSKIDDRLEHLEGQLLDQVNDQNATLILSRQAQLQLIHQIQALIWMNRGLIMNQTQNYKFKFPKLDLTKVLEEPEYQFPFNTNSKTNNDEH